MRCSCAVLIGLLNVCALIFGAATAAPPQTRGAIPGSVSVAPLDRLSLDVPRPPAPPADGISRDATTIGGGVLTSSRAGPTLAGALTPQAPALSVIALVCPNVVDLAWDHADLTHSENGQPCVKDGWWAIFRGTSPDHNTWKTLGFAGPWGDGFYRDEDVETGDTYYYGILVRFQCPGNEDTTLCLFPCNDPSVVTDVCHGHVVHDLTLSGDLNSSSLTVSHGATLKLSNATIRGGSISTNMATPEVSGGALQVFGSTLEAHAKLRFFTDADNRLTDSVINGDPTFTEVVVDDVATVRIERNQFYSGTIEMASAPQAYIYDNDFRRGRVYAHFCQPASVPQMIVYHNRFYDVAQHMAINQSGGTMLIEDNAFLATEPDSDKCTIEVRTSWNEEPTVCVIRLNKIIGYEEGIVVGQPPVQVTVEDNLILGADTALDFRIDATVDVRDNTIRDGDVGLYAWFGPKAGDPSISLRDNCIAGNNWGVRTYPCGTTFTVDARENWWGDPSGPEHVDNPTGQGDRAKRGAMIADWLRVDNCMADLATGVVSGTGGSVSTPGGGITVSLPPGGVPADTRVSIKSRHPAAMDTLPSGPQGLTAIRLFDVSADDQASGIPVTELAEEGVLSVQLTAQQAHGAEPTSLGLWRLGDASLVTGWTSWDPKPTAAAGETWSLLPTDVGSDGEILTATTEYLGTFPVLGESVVKDVYLPLVVRAVAGCREGDRAVER